MIITNSEQVAGDYLSYNAASVTYNSVSYEGKKSNQIILTGNGVKRLDAIQACWDTVSNSVDPATLRSAALLIIEGDFGKGSNGAYQDIFIDPKLNVSTIQALYPNIKIKNLIYTVGSSHRIITLGDLGIMIEQDKTLTILQTPMYISGNTDAQPGATIASLSCQVSEVFPDSKNPDYEFKLR